VKVLFLDVDGVLNSLEHRGTEGRGGCFGMAQIHVDELLRIIRSTGCSIVVSSAWRQSTLKKTLSVNSDFGKTLRLREGGKEILQVIIGVTSDEGYVRGKQIAQWLSDNRQVERFAIVDDDSDMAHLSKFLFQTRFETGLTPDIADQIIGHLNAATVKESLTTGVTE
jgi:hypothetical protein